jgi:hypothetical protein
VVGERVGKSKTWPDNARAISGRLRRAATFLRKIGIEVCFERVAHGTRKITITTIPATEKDGNFASPPSPPSPHNDSNDLRVTQRVTQKSDGSPTVTRTVTRNPLENKDGDDGDAGDAKIPAFSAPLVGRCAQCHGPAADAPLDEAFGVCLHEQCRAFWLRRDDA